MHHRIAPPYDELPLDEAAVRAKGAGARQQGKPDRRFGVALPFFDQAGRIFFVGFADGDRRARLGGRERLKNSDRRYDQRDQAASGDRCEGRLSHSAAAPAAHRSRLISKYTRHAMVH